MKEMLFWLLECCSRPIPMKIRHGLVKGLLREPGLLERYGFSYLGIIAQRSNIVRVAVRGEYGVFSSSPQDRTILPAYARKGVWSSPMVDQIKAFFSANHGTYLDIGANVGMTLVPIAASLSEVSCFAFEPEPQNYGNLLRNIAENCKFENVTAYQLALFDRSTKMPFEIAEGNLGDHRLRVATGSTTRLNEEARKTIEVPCARLDDLGLPIKQPLLAKIDTQGAESFVFAGGERTLAQADVILFEWCPYMMERLRGDPRRMLEFLGETFTWAAIDDPEGSPHSNRRKGSMAEIVSYLESSFPRWRQDPTCTVDVVVGKHRG